MNELQYVFLTIVTENQTKKIKAEKLSELIKKELGDGWKILNIDKYDKLEKSYKIEFKKSVSENNKDRINNLAISLTDKLVSPWLLYYDKEENNIELIYNKNENTLHRKIEFNVIKWGQLQITK